MYQGMAGVPGASWALCVGNFMQKLCNWHFQFPVSLSCVKQLQFKSLLSDCLKGTLLPFPIFPLIGSYYKQSRFDCLGSRFLLIAASLVKPRETDTEKREGCCFGVCNQTYLTTRI